MSEPKFLSVGVAHVGNHLFGVAALHNPAYEIENGTFPVAVETHHGKSGVSSLELRRWTDPNSEAQWLVTHRLFSDGGGQSRLVEWYEFNERLDESAARRCFYLMATWWQKCGRLFLGAPSPFQSALPVSAPLSFDASNGKWVEPQSKPDKRIPAKPAPKRNLESQLAEKRMHGARLKVLSKSWPALTSELQAKSGNAVAAYEYEHAKQKPAADPIDTLLATHALEWSGQPYEAIRQELKKRGHEIKVEALKKRISNLSYEKVRSLGPKPGK